MTAAHEAGCRCAECFDDAELRALVDEPGSVGAIARGALQRREQERLELDASGVLIAKAPTPEQLLAVRDQLDKIQRGARPQQVHIDNHFDLSAALAALDTEAGRDAVRRALEISPYARHDRQQAPPPAPIDLLTDRHAVREAIEDALARESAPPGRPDGFDQGRIDEIKATMLATGPRRGGR